MADKKEKEEYICPYCGRKFKSGHALGGHKANCPKKDEHRKIEVEMLATVWIGDKQYISGKTYEVTLKTYKNHKGQMKPVRKEKWLG